MTDRRDSLSTPWALTLAAAAVLGSLAAACMMPLVALGVLAAATMPRGAAVVTVLGAWLANQLLGFGAMGYPWEAQAFVWGAALGGAGLAVTLAAAAALDRLPPRSWALPVVFLAGFALFEVALYAVALAIGGTEMFAPAIVRQVFVNDAMWFVGLFALRTVLTRAAPGWYPRLSHA